MTEYYTEGNQKVADKIKELKSCSARYQDMSERLGKESHQVSGKQAVDFQTAKYKTSWRGVNMMKDCREIAVYQSLLWELKPKTIIELGTYTGASALWFVDTMKAIGEPCHAYTVDLAAENVNALAKEHPDITFIQGDAGKLPELLPTEQLSALPHPWLIVEDCHVSVSENMEYLAKHMQVGDYFVIEDTSPHIYTSGWGLLSEEEMEYGGAPDGLYEDHHAKHTIVVDFLHAHAEFKVDSYYADYFAFNATNTWDGYLKKVSSGVVNGHANTNGHAITNGH